MAIVLDEYGAPSGLITTEDLLEEIVGELRDEYDKEEENDILKLSDSDYEVDGSIRLDDLNGVLGTTLTSKDYDSIGGHILELLDHLPTVGEIASEHNLIFTVTKMDKNRIQRVHIQMLNNNEEFPS
jgi:CBS domain containing-hemolysin-like protein